jgi:hypothetical protein
MAKVTKTRCHVGPVPGLLDRIACDRASEETFEDPPGLGGSDRNQCPHLQGKRQARLKLAVQFRDAACTQEFAVSRSNGGNSRFAESPPREQVPVLSIDRAGCRGLRPYLSRKQPASPVRAAIPEPE